MITSMSTENAEYYFLSFLTFDSYWKNYGFNHHRLIKNIFKYLKINYCLNVGVSKISI